MERHERRGHGHAGMERPWPIVNGESVYLATCGNISEVAVKHHTFLKWPETTSFLAADQDARG